MGSTGSSTKSITTLITLAVKYLRINNMPSIRSSKQHIYSAKICAGSDKLLRMASNVISRAHANKNIQGYEVILLKLLNYMPSLQNKQIYQLLHWNTNSLMYHHIDENKWGFLQPLRRGSISIKIFGVQRPCE